MKKHILIAIIIISISSLFLASCQKSENEKSLNTEQTVLDEPPYEPAKIEIDSTAEQAKTIENLQAAYGGEVIAKAKYAAYAKKADEEGFSQIASLYRAVSAAEHIHAGNHQAVLAESAVDVLTIKPEFTVKTTKENLEADIKGEAYEATSMYPGYIKSAENADNQIGIVSLTYAMKTEKKHNLMYIEAHNALQDNNVKALPSVFYVCSLCGDTYANKAPARCTFCMTKGEKFLKISKVKAKRAIALNDCDM